MQQIHPVDALFHAAMKVSDNPDEYFPEETAVQRFLEANPEFLIDHPSLLLKMSVPHGVGGGTVSLLEYQARLMREKLAHLQQQNNSQRLREYSSRILAQKLPELTTRLFECDHGAELLGLLQTFLVSHYDANWVRIFVAPESAHPETTELEYVRLLEPRIRGLFCLLMNNPKPLCDSLQHEHLSALFGEPADRIHSTLLVPFRYGGGEALLAVASMSWQRYSQGTELDLLVSIIRILSGLSSYLD